MCMCFPACVRVCFRVCSHRFCALVKDLEMMMQNLISSLFKTVYSVEEGVRLLDIFRPLSPREVFLSAQSSFSISHSPFSFCSTFLF